MHAYVMKAEKIGKV